MTLSIWRRREARPTGLVPCAGIGAGIAVPHVDVTPVRGQHTFSYQVAGPALQAILGQRRDLSASWSTFGEVKAA
ncbi:MAG: hypothetical protein JNK34_03215 [Tabrizicola sp.]|nr:hypothetical protein [Tabrizicola sp.]